METEKLLKLVGDLIDTLEAEYPKSELIGESPLKDLYLSARAARYNLKNAPEAFVKKG